MKYKINLKFNNENDLNYYIKSYNEELNPILNIFINILWNKYYKLFDTDNIFNEPFDFIDKINKFYYCKFFKKKFLNYKNKNSNFINYLYLFNKYKFLLKKNILVIIQQSNLLGHLESLHFLNKKFDILRFTNFNYFNKYEINKINKNIKNYSKSINKIINYNKKPDIKSLNKIKQKYDFIIFDLSNWLNISAEYLEIANSNLLYYAFLFSLSKLNINGSLLLSMSINTKFSADIILIIKEFFNDCILDDNNSINFIDNSIYNINVIFKELKNVDIEKSLIKFKSIFNHLLNVNKSSHSFNIQNISDRTNYLITKPFNDNYQDSIFTHPSSLIKLNIKSKKYNFIRKFNIKSYTKKINKIKNIILLYKKYKKKIPDKYNVYQLKKSYNFLKNNNIIH